MKGYIHSIQSMGTVDGPGVRTVVFTEGCPVRCAYCHNPDTWERREAHLVEASALAERILRFYPYIKNGGVTFSGGEPCLEAAFLTELASLLKERGLHIALDTAGVVYNEEVATLLDLTDLVLLDIKMTTEEDYRKYVGASLSRVLSFLSELEKRKKAVWIRHVVVPGINDTEEDILRLKEMLAPYQSVERIELLPFKTLCLEKYEAMGIPFPLAGTPPLSAERLASLSSLL